MRFGVPQVSGIAHFALSALLFSAIPTNAYQNTNGRMLARAPRSFVHPGVFLDTKQLDFIHSQVNTSQEPWASAYTNMMSSSLADLSRQAAPLASVECGSTSVPDIGCSAERKDALAAYIMSLAWYITKDSQYAQKAIEYFNAWSYVIQEHTLSNAPLQTGWSAASWTRAAEIIRYTYNGWNAADITQFETMLRNVYLPEIIGGSKNNGNWELVMMEAAQGIAVFLNNATAYDISMSTYLLRVPAYVYLTSDGPLPHTAPIDAITTTDKLINKWFNQSTFVDGISQETCRDFKHVGYGLSSIGHVAETARIQGCDLYTFPVQNDQGVKVDVAKRLLYGLEFHAQFDLGVAQPDWLCLNTATNTQTALVPGLGSVTEVGLNALTNRLHYSMPNTTQLTLGERPEGTNSLFQGWETLTNAGNPF